MAAIENQLLKTEKTGDVFEKASVGFEVKFTSREVEEIIHFGGKY